MFRVLEVWGWGSGIRTGSCGFRTLGVTGLQGFRAVEFTVKVRAGSWCSFSVSGFWVVGLDFIRSWGLGT